MPTKHWKPGVWLLLIQEVPRRLFSAARTCLCWIEAFAVPQQAQDVHALIRARVAESDAAVASELQILYGGSVKPGNARELFAMPDIDGGLIGGASLVAEDFLAICAAA